MDTVIELMIGNDEDTLHDHDAPYDKPDNECVDHKISVKGTRTSVSEEEQHKT